VDAVQKHCEETQGTISTCLLLHVLEEQRWKRSEKATQLEVYLGFTLMHPIYSLHAHIIALHSQQTLT
jgi:hypothetical protein